MNKSLMISKKAQFQSPKNRNPSIAMRAEDMNLGKAATNIDLSKFMVNNQSKNNKWLNHLHEKPLLQLMADTLEQKQIPPVNATELNCYERLKKLLSMQTGNTYEDKSSQKHQSMLEDVAVLEDRLNKMEAKYNSTHSNHKKGSKYARSYLCSNSSSFHDKKTMNNSVSITQTSMIAGKSSTHELKKRTIRSPERRSHANRSIKDEILEFKAKCCEKFIDYKKEVNAKVYNQIEDYIQNKIEKKMEDVVSCKFSQMDVTKEENQRLKMLLLQKDLEIEMLKKELKLKEEKLRQKQLKESQSVVTYHYTVQQFYDEYQNVFGDVPLLQLKAKIDQLENLYFNKYAYQQGKHLQKLGNLNREKEQLQKQMKSKCLEFQEKEREFQDLITQIRKHQLLDNSTETHEIYNRIPYYKIKCSQLESLQKFILNKYIQWSTQLSDVESEVTQLVNGKSTQDYEHMIQKIVDFNNHFASKEKNIEYLTKILGGIQKLKKIITPSKGFEKLEPLKVLQQVQMILKNPKRRREQKLRTIYKENTEINHQYLNDC